MDKLNCKPMYFASSSSFSLSFFFLFYEFTRLIGIQMEASLLTFRRQLRSMDFEER